MLGATDVRFFQQQGYSTAAAVTSGAVVGAAGLIVKGALFLIAIPLDSPGKRRANRPHVLAYPAPMGHVSEAG